MSEELELARKIGKIILAGKVDGKLDTLLDILISRKKKLIDEKAHRNMLELNVGDKVVVVGSIKPRYLLGKVGTITRFDHTKRSPILVSFGRPLGKFTSGTVFMPASCLEKYADKAEEPLDNVRILKRVNDDDRS
jgi:hypothetical protein